MDTTGPRPRRSEDGEKLVARGHVDKFDAGRVCQAPDCMTVLSRYNPSSFCSRHEGWDRSAGNGRARMERYGPDEAIDWVMEDQQPDTQ